MKPVTSNRDLNLSSLVDIIVVPQGSEYQAVCRGLSKSGFNGVEIISIPLGTNNLPQVLTSYSQQLSIARNVLIMGFCGSLSQLYNVGDVILVKSCQDLLNSQINLDLNLTIKLQNILSVNLVAGLTSDRIITQAQEKQKLAQQYSVSVVEMEGYAYVRELQQRGISVAMLRVVSDGLRGDIPDLSNAIDHQGNIKGIPMAIAFIKQPLAAIRLIRGSLMGLKALEQITARLFSH